MIPVRFLRYDELQEAYACDEYRYMCNEHKHMYSIRAG